MEENNIDIISQKLAVINIEEKHKQIRARVPKSWHGYCGLKYVSYDIYLRNQ